MKYDTEKRVFMVNKYAEFKNVAKVQRAWRTEFKNLKAPDKGTILYNVCKFEKTGSVNHVARKVPKHSVKRLQAKNKIKDLISEKPNLSIRKLAVDSEISYELVRMILKDDLKLKPYKPPVLHELQPADYEKRVKFAQWFLKLPLNTVDYIIFSDEAYFGLTEKVNKQNNRLWLEKKTEEVHEMPLYDDKILVWCAISATKIYGPFFFESSVNKENYLEMLRNFFWPKQLRTKDYKKYYFQQDGATPHTAIIVQEWLKSKFLTKFIDKFDWPPRSPDLNPCDFFLWGYLKSKVYNPLPATLDQLKANITREIKNIIKETLILNLLDFKKRCNLVIELKGAHIENKL